MSATLGIVARRWRCVLRYIGGETRTRNGMGVVEDSSKKVFHSNNPLDELGYQAAEDDHFVLPDELRGGSTTAPSRD